MKKGVAISVVAAVFILIIGQTADAGMPKEITFTTGGGMATSVYAASAALAPMMERKLGIKVRVTPFEVVRERYTGLRDGKVHVNLAAMMNAMFAAEGFGPSFADKNFGPQAFRHVWFFYTMHWGYMVRGDSDIKSLSDIKGKRVGLGVHSQGCITAVDALLAFVNLKKEDVKMVPVGSWAALQRSISEGRSDVTFTAAESGVVYEVEANPKGIRFLPMPHKNKEAWKRFLKINISSFPVVINKGVKSAWGIESYASAYAWVVHKNTDEELVYQMTKFAHQNWNEYKGLHKVFKDNEGTLENQRGYLNTTSFVVHPGTVRYLKEIGFWTAEDDQRNRENMELEKRYEDAWQAALAEAKAKKIKVSPKNKKWMSLWDSHRSKLPRKGTRID
jgi:TRAP transporter TAXI family solute receptor